MNNLDMTALYNIGYGLYAITTHDGSKHNAMICNSVMQVSNTPTLAVSINKTNYTCDTIQKSGIFNINCLTVDTTFDTFQQFGFVSGKDFDKMANISYATSSNGLAVLNDNINGFISVKVDQAIDMDSHYLFICSTTQAMTFNKKPTMSYAYYHSDVKPKQTQPQQTGYICKICGYVYEGELLPQDYICPICKHPASDFEKLK